MKTIISIISEHVAKAFKEAGYEETYGKVTLSNRPDLCEYQCNGAMAAAKQYKKAPLVIANDVAAFLKEDDIFSDINAAAPGFLNMKMSDSFLTGYLDDMRKADRFGVCVKEKADKVIIDYGGPNVAKPLHVGHLRSAIIGESLKRILRYAGDEVIGDIHLGDWGLQMGLIMAELRERKPDLPYFDEGFTGEYPKEPPFTLAELEEIYPAASKRSKEDDAFKEVAMNDTFMLQKGERGRTALWQHIMNVSIPDLKGNYEKLDVSFDLWKGESDAKPYIDGVVNTVKDKGLAYESEGALVVDVKEDTDQKEMPPCMILKSDGASLYTTTDLATLLQRSQDYDPDRVLYVADKRQEMHFTQVFRCARKAGIVKEDTDLKFLGFGTMNGRDGKPFKTREGGVMRLESLINDINEEMYNKIRDNHDVEEEEARLSSRIVALAAVKYGDLSNQAAKDYIFDTDKFTSFEGNTGPYILYTIVRIKSILKKYSQAGNTVDQLDFNRELNDNEKALVLSLVRFSQVIENACEELAPHKICAYIYDTSNAFNRFYHETRILNEEDEAKQKGYIALLKMTMDLLETSIDLLGFKAPEKM